MDIPSDLPPGAAAEIEAPSQNFAAKSRADQRPTPSRGPKRDRSAMRGPRGLSYLLAQGRTGGSAVTRVDRNSLVVSVPEAARLLGISRTHAYALVSRGELTHLRLGRRIVVPKRAIDAMLGATAEVPSVS